MRMVRSFEAVEMENIKLCCFGRMYNNGCGRLCIDEFESCFSLRTFVHMEDLLQSNSRSTVLWLWK